MRILGSGVRSVRGVCGVWGCVGFRETPKIQIFKKLLNEPEECHFLARKFKYFKNYHLTRKNVIFGVKIQMIQYHWNIAM